MPYIIRQNKSKKNGRKKWLIVRKDTGQIVGSSSSKAKAGRSIGYREQGEKAKKVL